MANVPPNNSTRPAAPLPPSPPAPTAARPPRHFLRAFLTLVLLAAVTLALWTWVALSWSYSDGERAGILQKFSHKGWICKTWEGELAMYVVGGVAPQIWTFSVRDASVAADLSKRVGERLQLHYSEHKGIPTSCVADTPYFVEGIASAK